MFGLGKKGTTIHPLIVYYTNLVHGRLMDFLSNTIPFVPSVHQPVRKCVFTFTGVK